MCKSLIGLQNAFFFFHCFLPFQRVSLQNFILPLCIFFQIFFIKVWEAPFKFDEGHLRSVIERIVYRKTKTQVNFNLNWNEWMKQAPLNLDFFFIFSWRRRIFFVHFRHEFSLWDESQFSLFFGVFFFGRSIILKC